MKTEEPTTDQRDRFIKAAKQVGADEDEATFKAKLAAIARQKVKDKPAPMRVPENSKDG